MTPSTKARVVTALLLLFVCNFNRAAAWEPVKAHPDNPYILQFRGKPTLLRAFAGSYSAVIDVGEPFIPYLDVLQRDKMNVTRVWCLGFPPDYNQTPQDFLQPWPRSSSNGNALDGAGKWDLSAWNEDFFTRLRAFTQAASDRGIVVEYTLFSVFYGNEEWKAGPFHPSNNVQGYGPNNWNDGLRLINPGLLAAQKAAVRRIVRELNEFDNVFYEVMNEPFWNQPNVNDTQDVAFHNAMLAEIRAEESTLPNRHMIAHNFPQQSAALSSDFDIINEHYPAVVLTSTIAGAEALLQNQYSSGKLLSLDETDTDTALQVRLESWMFLIGGGGIYDGLDANGTVYNPADFSGDNALGNAMRLAVRNIGTYMDRLNLIPLRRDLSWVTGGKPTGATLQASATAGQQYVAYLHHGKSAQQNFQLAYNPIDSSNHNVSLRVNLPEGTWRAVWTRPSDLAELKVELFDHLGGSKTLETLTYQADVALRIDRTGTGDTTSPPGVTDFNAVSNENGSITLSWSAAEVFDVASYNIYRSDLPGVPLDEAHRIASVPAAVTSYDDQPELGGLTYFYVVTAVDQSSNESAPGTEANAFAIAPPQLSASAEHGSVTGPGSYSLNTYAILTATPDPGYVFVEWTGDITGADNPLSVLMDGNKTIIALFSPDNSDADLDGLSRFLEVTVYGTNPDLSDTDGDSLNDLVEINAGTNPLVVDTDEDGIPDNLDLFPLDPTETIDTDNDGIGNNADTDDDSDGVEDTNDAFPLDATETIDTDNDGIGNNADTDDDDDGVEDTNDAFPLDANETIDTDNDGIGNNADTDDDGDGVEDASDAFPLDATETIDTDNDGVGNNADTDDDGDGVEDASDAFPLDPTETIDTDNDGIGNNADTDDDSDGVEDTNDAFPLDITETIDTDNDGVGNNADTDDDGDGVEDASDAFPLDPTETIDTDNDGIGNNADTDDDGDGFSDDFEINSGYDPGLATSTPDALTSIRTAVEFRFNAASGVSYRIETSTDLIEWTTVETDIIGQSEVVTRFYSIENQPKRYFRVRKN